MKDQWRQRLKEMIDQDGRSMRALSTSAGLGPNFLHQLFRDQKDPGFSKLASVLSLLGSGATLYVTNGIKLSAPGERFLRLALSLDESDREVVEKAISRKEDAPS